MNGYNFVFSNKPLTRFYRHAFFWVIWWALYTLISLIRRVEFQHYTYFDALWLSSIEVFIQLPVDMMFCYFVIYFIIPRFLYEEKIMAFLFAWIASVLFISALQYFYLDLVILPFRKEVLGKPVPKQPGFLLSLVAGTISFNVEAGFATSIRLVKRTFQQKTEAQLTRMDLDSYKNRVELSKNDAGSLFLSGILNRINSIITAENSKMAGLLKKFNFLMNYVAYDCRNQTLALNREIEALHHFIDIHQQIAGGQTRISISETGLTEQMKSIAPMVLIGFADMYLGNEQCVARGKSVEIFVELRNNQMECMILYTGNEIILDDFTEDGQLRLYRRLNIIYPQGFEIKKIMENEIMKTILTLDLSKIVYR